MFDLELSDLETLDSCVNQTTKYYYKRSWDDIRNNFYKKANRFQELKDEITKIQGIDDNRCLFLTKYIENLDDEHILELSECAECIKDDKPEKVEQDTWNKFQQVFNNRTENVKRYAPTWIIEKISFGSNISDKCFPWIKVLDINYIDESNIDEVIKRLWRVYRKSKSDEDKESASRKLQAIFNKPGVKLSSLSETISIAKYIYEKGYAGSNEDLKEKIYKIDIKDSNDVIYFGNFVEIYNLFDVLYEMFSDTYKDDDEFKAKVKSKVKNILGTLSEWNVKDVKEKIEDYKSKFDIE